MDETHRPPSDLQSDLLKRILDLSRLALTGSRRDIELSIRRLSKSVAAFDAKYADRLRHLLTVRPSPDQPFRDTNPRQIPLDSDSRINLLRSVFPDNDAQSPIHSADTQESLDRIIAEHAMRSELLREGVDASHTLLFYGPPGVGKTMSARWLSRRLSLPLLVVDLSVVMSSFLGKTGANIRNIFDYAREAPCVLLLDEMDSLAKKRDDAGDVGELKRLVTVLIQEIDAWPSSSLLIGATNHPNLLDPAIWRRFDSLIEFSLPDQSLRADLIRQLTSPASELTPQDALLLAAATNGMSHSEIEREVTSIKRESIVFSESRSDVLRRRAEALVRGMEKADRHAIAFRLNANGFSQREMHRITGVSRDTIRRAQQSEKEAT